MNYTGTNKPICFVTDIWQSLIMTHVQHGGVTDLKIPMMLLLTDSVWHFFAAAGEFQGWKNLGFLIETVGC